MREPLLWSHNIDRKLTDHEKIMRDVLMEVLPMDYPPDQVAVNLVIELEERGWHLVRPD